MAKPGVVIMTVISVLRTQRQEHHSGFKATLTYIVSSKAIWVNSETWLKKIQKNKGSCPEIRTAHIDTHVSPFYVFP